MFGHQDDKPHQDTSAAGASDHENSGAEDKPAGQPTIQPPLTAPTISAVSDSSTTAPGPAKPQPNGQAWQHPGAPIADKDDQEQVKDIISPAGGFPKRPSYQYPVPDFGGGSNSLGDNVDETTSELIEIKQHALGELAPLIDQLDLPPEEKFRTIMMMIQASDDETMVKAAYAAAHSIKDEKDRAEALLAIINEVNYFTQTHDSDDQ